jgi:hypothetical protein
MATQLTAEGAQQSLTAHVEARGIEVFVKYGPQIGWGELQRLLMDRAYVRYPCEIVFDAANLLAGEFAYPHPRGEAPEEGFTMFVHPVFMLELARVPALALYHLVAVNYGEFASSDDAETFGAAALGLTRDEYYAMLCEAADQVGGPEQNSIEAGGCGSGCSHG